MRKMIILLVVGLLAGCGDPNYVDPAQATHKHLDGRPIPIIETLPSAT